MDMPNRLIRLWLIILMLSVFVLNSEQLFLKQAVILSRHGVKTPLLANLFKSSPKSWPKWEGEPGFLTAKGVHLEGNMGKYFYSWLNEKNLLPPGCPTEKDFYVYSSNSQRSLDSSKAFVSNAFPFCNITVNHAADVDPILNPYLRNSSSLFLQEATRIMQDKIDNSQFNNSLRELEMIIDYKNSKSCLKDHHCDLITNKNTAVLVPGHRPRIDGPLKISKSAIDSFITEYYEGFEMNNVAWGLLDTEEKWQTLLDLKHMYHKISFDTAIIARDISGPLRNYFTDMLLGENAPKITFLMGHSVSIFTFLNTLGFKPYTLKRQREIVPIGGKVVFQRWSNTTGDYLKIDYVYQPWEDMREGKPLSLESPPLSERLELNNCRADANGFCSWDEFVSVLKNSF